MNMYMSGSTSMTGSTSVDEASITPEDIDLLKKHREEHCDKGQTKYVRWNMLNLAIGNEIHRLNAKIFKEIEDHMDLQRSDYEDDENTELMIQSENCVRLYCWMKKLLLEKWRKNLKLQEKAFNKFVKETEQLFRMEQCARSQLNLEEAKDFAIHEIWDPEEPSLEHEMDLENGIHGYKIKMRLNTPPESRESSSDEE